MMNAIRRLAAQKKQKGVTLIEYALIASLISVMLIVALTGVKDGIEAAFNAVITALTPV